THVAGIIAAERNNNIGMNGVAVNVEIMTLRAVPDGDEYDKDIALAIRYAADNGAKVINTSFGKYYSPHPGWVRDAIKYAASKDVLIVNAAGNDALDLDTTEIYPNDAVGTSPEMADNFLTVGALHHEYGNTLVADFSNYGKYNVDVFAPGTKIWSTMPNNTYDFSQGTSMASPAVAG
ncbi:MAG: S8 family serine peptidase, partial [Sinomicrobium sp.]|nr:S8 family serine peptidase [Sinomicrobium sp.]